jgi:hypothetical protein
MEVLDYMIASRPGFRYEHCSAGGTLKDFDSLQRINMMTTNDRSYSLHYRQALYSCSYSINPVQLKSDNSILTDEDSTAGAKYNFRTGMLGAWMADADSRPAYLTDYAAHIALYKTKQRPILRNAQVFHILPLPDGTNWDGVEYFNPSLGTGGKGSVFLFKPGSGAGDSKVIYLKGLDSTANYTISFQDGHGTSGTYTGAALMNGITVSGMTGAFATEIIWIN